MDLEHLLLAANRKERSKASKQAESKNISVEEALLAILSRKAKRKKITLSTLISRRLAQRQAEKLQRQKQAAINRQTWQAWFDGAAEPTNPGPRGIGGLLVSPDKTERVEISRAIGYGTNNEAEYEALIAVLESALEKGVEYLLVHGDSALVINQTMGDWQVKSPNLFGFCRKCKELARQFKSCKFRWIRREQNKAADNLSKKALEKLLDNTGWGNQTDIGRKLGLSAVAVGKRLKAAGLRDADGHATPEAIAQGFARLLPNRFGSKLEWHVEQTANFLAGNPDHPINHRQGKSDNVSGSQDI